MTTRTLPASEWPRLDGFAIWPEIRAVAGTSREADSLVLVVEDDGEIVGCCGLFPRVIAEAWEIAPAHQKRGVVLRHLLRAVTAQAAALGATQVLSGCVSEEVRAILNALGATKLPDIYSWTFQERG